MAIGKVPNEGEVLIANLIFKGADANRGVNLELLLFTNMTLNDTSTYSQLTEPTGGGYARKTLVDANWAITADTTTGTAGAVAGYAVQAFVPTGVAWSGIYGAALVTTGTSPKILAFIVDPTAPLAVPVGVAYNVTPSLPVGKLA